MEIYLEGLISTFVEEKGNKNEKKKTLNISEVEISIKA